MTATNEFDGSESSNSARAEQQDHRSWSQSAFEHADGSKVGLLEKKKYMLVIRHGPTLNARPSSLARSCFHSPFLELLVAIKFQPRAQKASRQIIA